jgi:hypothetical protein
MRDKKKQPKPIGKELGERMANFAFVIVSEPPNGGGTRKK